MKSRLLSTLATSTATAVLLAFAASSSVAAPEIVAGPGADPDCFKPLTAETQYFQWPAKPGPYRIALVNGFIANDWRGQRIKVAKAYAEQPEVAADIEEFKVISVGEPPLPLGISVLHALSDAVASVADHKVLPRLDAPATPERVLMAMERLRGKAGA